MKTAKSSGYDKISVKLLQVAGGAIVVPLTYIFNQSLKTGIFPDDWKIAKVTPIHKSEEKTLCGNYRPISVISIVPKVFEKVVHEQLMKYLEHHQIISKFQSGFRVNHSTETSLLHVTNSWLANMDAGLINGVLFLDLKKAFDTVNHKILLSKLGFYGIRGLALSWFQSYLSNRKQICKVNNSLSTFQNITCGIPQGSNLGPLLFTIYINDLPNSLEITEPAMFADDTSLTATGESSFEIEYKLGGEIQNVKTWLDANKLTLNEEKTEYMLIGSGKRLKQIRNDPIIKIRDHIIKRVYKKKVLGLEIDDKLQWTKHVEKQTKKISCSIAMLRKVKPYVPQATLQMIVRKKQLNNLQATRTKLRHLRPLRTALVCTSQSAIFVATELHSPSESSSQTIETPELQNVVNPVLYRAGKRQARSPVPSKQVNQPILGASCEAATSMILNPPMAAKTDRTVTGAPVVIIMRGGIPVLLPPTCDTSRALDPPVSSSALGFTYLFTCIYRYSRWIEAIPMEHNVGSWPARCSQKLKPAFLEKRNDPPLKPTTHPMTPVSPDAIEPLLPTRLDRVFVPKLCFHHSWSIFRIEQPSDKEVSPEIEQPLDEEDSPEIEQPSDKEVSPEIEQPSDKEVSPEIEQPSDKEVSPEIEQPSDKEVSPENCHVTNLSNLNVEK
ncbi:Hypothetical predicted protein, partial [Paramuricea clavata]